MRSLFLLAVPVVLVACASDRGEESDATSAALSTTTTKTLLTANNTSASTAFRDLYTPAVRFDGAAIGVVSNGDNPTSATASPTLAEGAISKLSLHRLLSGANANAKIFFETQSWFCTNGTTPIPTGLGSDQCGSHIDIGYDTDARVATQVADMRSRGADGVLIDWDGRNAKTNTSAIGAFKAAAEASGGAFQFAVMEDEGVKSCAATAGCDITGAVLSDISYLATNYFGSSAYWRVNGRPVLFFFGIDVYASNNGKTIDWSYVRAHAAGNPLFVFQNTTHGVADGNFSWPKPTPIASYPGSDPFGLAGYLPDFYARAKAPLVFGVAYKGFDDHVVNGWLGKGNGRRYLGQQCGKTWLDTFAAANAHSGIAGVQIATWDDYEEGTEVETGIDNHLAVTGRLSGNTLSWTLAAAADAPADCTQAIAGGFDLAATVDHFAVYSTTDDEHFALLADDLPATTRSLDVAGKTGSFYVRAVGKPSITNKLSPAVRGSTTPPPATCSGEPTILEPTSGEDVGPSIRLRVSAPSCIQAMIAYVDGQQVLKVDGSSIDAWVPVTMGAHQVNVNGWAGTAEAHVSARVPFVRTY